MQSSETSGIVTYMNNTTTIPEGFPDSVTYVRLLATLLHDAEHHDSAAALRRWADRQHACADCGEADDTAEYQWTGEFVCDECGYARHEAEGFLSTLDDLRDWGK